MKMDDAIVEFGFDCKVRKLSEKTVANHDLLPPCSMMNIKQRVTDHPLFLYLNFTAVPYAITSAALCMMAEVE